MKTRTDKLHIVLIAFTQQGCLLAGQLCTKLEAQGHTVHASGPKRFADAAGIYTYESLESWTRDAFKTADALVFISATGIAVRSIAPYVHDKFSDPAVVSIDEGALYVVPLLSGHVGGANDLARTIAALCGAQAVISTATDVHGLFAVDEWARKNSLAVIERNIAKEISAALLEGQTLGFACDFPFAGTLPSGLALLQEEQEAPALGIHVSLHTHTQAFARTLHLVPRIASIGIGCKRNTAAAQIESFIEQCLDEAHIATEAVAKIASIDIKADERGLQEVAAAHHWQLCFYSAQELAAVPGEFASSAFVEQTVGVDNVCERAACAEGGTLLLARQSNNGVTLALAAPMGQCVCSFEERKSERG